MCEGGKDEDDKRHRTEVNIDRKRSWEMVIYSDPGLSSF
jgi:hypothetical protein